MPSSYWQWNVRHLFRSQTILSLKFRVQLLFFQCHYKTYTSLYILGDHQITFVDSTVGQQSGNDQLTSHLLTKKISSSKLNHNKRGANLMFASSYVTLSCHRQSLDLTHLGFCGLPAKGPNLGLELDTTRTSVCMTRLSLRPWHDADMRRWIKSRQWDLFSFCH